MKQQITLKQWNELSDEEKILFADFFKLYLDEGFPKSYCKCARSYLPTIGQLIEYLGDDLHNMHRAGECEESDCYDWHIVVKTIFNGEKGFLTLDYKELIDALWEATKHKLTTNI